MSFNTTRGVGMQILRGAPKTFTHLKGGGGGSEKIVRLGEGFEIFTSKGWGGGGG